MDIGFDYAQLVSHKYEHAVRTPLISAWEFMNRPTNLPWQKDWDKINRLSIRYNWSLNLNLKEILRKQEKAIVVTDAKQTIEFVSAEFETMTGYQYSEALGRKPNFLQGPKTDAAITQKIRDAIKSRESVSQTVLNYKKDGSIYFCKVDIHPIFDASKNLVNFIAIEKQL
jgi:PAS domain S-box-containing protein